MLLQIFFLREFSQTNRPSLSLSILFSIPFSLSSSTINGLCRRRNAASAALKNIPSKAEAAAKALQDDNGSGRRRPILGARDRERESRWFAEHVTTTRMRSEQIYAHFGFWRERERERVSPRRRRRRRGPGGHRESTELVPVTSSPALPHD